MNFRYCQHTDLTNCSCHWNANSGIKGYRIVCVLFYFCVLSCFVCQNAYYAKHVPLTTQWLDTFWTCALVNKYDRGRDRQREREREACGQQQQKAYLTSSSLHSTADVWHCCCLSSSWSSLLSLLFVFTHLLSALFYVCSFWFFAYTLCLHTGIDQVWRFTMLLFCIWNCICVAWQTLWRIVRVAKKWRTCKKACNQILYICMCMYTYVNLATCLTIR